MGSNNRVTHKRTVEMEAGGSLGSRGKGWTVPQTGSAELGVLNGCHELLADS